MILDDLRERRQELGLTQAELATLAGLSVPLIQLLERGDGNPSIETIERLGRSLGFRLRLEMSPVDWSVLVKAGLPLTEISPSNASFETWDLVREFRLAWKQARNEREILALKAMLLAYKLHYPSFYRRHFEAKGISLNWADVDGRVLKLARMAKAMIRA